MLVYIRRGQVMTIKDLRFSVEKDFPMTRRAVKKANDEFIETCKFEGFLMDDRVKGPSRGFILSIRSDIKDFYTFKRDKVFYRD
jgi:hypothetical protein